MAQAASIVVNDRESTPVAHTYAPRSITPDLATFVETGTVPIGERKLTLSSRKSGSNYRVRVKLVSPVLVNETINGVSVPTVPRVSYADVTFTFADTSTLQERKNLVGMFANALAASQTVVDGTVTGLEGIW